MNTKLKGQLTRLKKKISEQELIQRKAMVSRITTEGTYNRLLKKEYPCRKCSTTGQIHWKDVDGYGDIYNTSECSECRGNGYIIPEGHK